MDEEYVVQEPMDIEIQRHSVYGTLEDMNMKASSNRNPKRFRQSDAWETVRSKSPDAGSFLQDADKFPMYVRYVIVTCYLLHVPVVYHVMNMRYCYVAIDCKIC